MSQIVSRVWESVIIFSYINGNKVRCSQKLESQAPGQSTEATCQVWGPCLSPASCSGGGALGLGAVSALGGRGGRGADRCLRLLVGSPTPKPACLHYSSCYWFVKKQRTSVKQLQAFGIRIQMSTKSISLGPLHSTCCRRSASSSGGGSWTVYRHIKPGTKITLKGLSLSRKTPKF